MGYPQNKPKRADVFNRIHSTVIPSSHETCAQMTLTRLIETTPDPWQKAATGWMTYV